MSSANSDQLLENLLDLAEEEQREYLRSRPELLDRSLGERLLAEALGQTAVDLQRAGSLASTGQWLAQELDDDYLRGRSQRMAANVTHIKGDHHAAADLYEAALASFQRIGDELEDAITRSSALQNLVFFGEYRRAFEWADVAKEIFERLGDRLRLARLELNLANILFRQDRWEEAANRYENAYLEFRNVGDPKDVAISLANMAVCHSSLNDFMQALELYDRARTYSEQHDLPVMVAEIDYNIAYLHYLRGEYTRAIELYRETRTRCEEIGDNYHVALCDLDQAEIFLELNLIEEAVDLAQQAYNRFEKLGVQYETAKALTFLAIAVSRTGKSFLALELLHSARELFIREENETWQALINLYESLVLYRAGRPLEAARLAESALQGFSASSLPTKAAMCEILLARLRCDNGAYKKARRHCADVLKRLKDIDAPGLRHQVYYVLGQIEEADGELEAAFAAYRCSQVKLEQLRSHLQVEELKIGFLDDKLSVYESLAWLTLRSGATASDKESAFTYIERAKSRSLADLLSFRAHALSPTTAARSEQAEQVRKLREELNWYYRQIDLQEMREDDRGRKDISQLREASRRQEDHLLRTLRELQSTDQEFSSLQEAATVDLESIRANMPSETLLVEYYLARGIIYACVLGPETIEIIPVSVASKVREIHRLLQFQLSKFRLGRDYVNEFSALIDEATQTHLHQLYEELVAPTRNLLDKQRLVFIPHGFLHYVPFHALFDGDRFLTDQYEISYAPSASAYYFCCVKKTNPDGRVVILGIPDGKESHLYEEVAAIAEELEQSQLLMGEKGSEEALRLSGEKSSIVYIATDTFHRRGNPMFSSIQLGTSELYLCDLYNLKLQADLVVLSGCGTGLESTEDREELVGMTRGILYAGAQSTLVTLWDVGDESVSLFMRSFFRGLKRKLGKAKALQEAVAKVRTRYFHPYYWAPYVLVGKAENAVSDSR